MSEPVGGAGRALAALVLAIPLACTSTSGNYPYLTPTGGSGGTSTPPTSGTVTIAITAPGDGAMVVTNSDVTVTATADVSGGTDVINTSGVTAVLTPMSGGAPLASSPLISSGSDVYNGTISLGALAAGNYTLTVSAKSSSGATGQAAVTLAVASGPTLIVNSPAEGQSYNGSLAVEIVVDQGAAPPSASLAGTPLTMLTLAASTGTTDIYRGTVAFAPATTPPAGVQTLPALSGTQILDVTESNGTTTVKVRRTFVIDTTGPTITASTPASGQVVGGVIPVSITVSDPSGVLDSSVTAVIGDEDGNPLYDLQLADQGSGVYSVLFDTANLTRCPEPPASGPCIVFPTISFRASDEVGNLTSLGYGFAVDNIAPVADLDPPQMRQMRLGMFGYECSFLFDPLSVNQDVGDMPNDGCMVPQVFDLRARIEDDGNDPNGTKVIPLAGIDPDNTSVYVLTDTTQPLVVDSDGDGNCDEINPLLAPTVGPLTQSDQVLKVQLAGVPLGGGADFEADSSLPTFPLQVGQPCGQGTATSPPKVLCTFEQPTVVISYAGGQPAVWSVEPIDSAFHCVGNQLDARANNIPDGQWICIAVGTRDLAGNKSVSAPMRVYVQYDDAGGFCATPPASAGPPPACAGVYDPATTTSSLGTCQARKFTGTELYCAPGGC